MTMKTTNARVWWAVAPIVLAVFAAFSPVAGNGWVDIDDKEAFVENPHLRAFTASNLWWAVTTTEVDAYQPLGRILHMTEFAAWGIHPRGYHLASVVYHGAMALGLFALTLALIRKARPDWVLEAPGRVLAASALAVTLYAAHPLRAEVVAWSVCRAYSISALFTTFSLLAYLRSTEPGRSRRVWLAGSALLYTAAMGFYQLPVALPFVLLVLDVYPLKRFSLDSTTPRRISAILAEKLPFFIVSLIFGIAALAARRPHDGVAALVETGIGGRVVQAAYASCFYLVKSVIPWGLCHVYPLRDLAELGEPAFVFSVFAILGVSVASMLLRHRYPLFPAAWLTYLLILAPNSGLVRNIGVVAADRYSYFAIAALVPALAACLIVVIGDSRRRFALALVPLLFLVPISRIQCGYWSDAVSLWGRAVAAQDRPEWFLHLNLGVALSDAGRPAEACKPFAEAAKLNPNDPMVHDKLGLALLSSGQATAAESEFTLASNIDPDDFEAHMNLGYLHTQSNRLDSAQEHLTQAVRIRPKQVEARSNLGAILAQEGRPDLAEIEFAEATRLDPNRPEGFMNLGFARLQQNKFPAASEAYSQATKLRSDDADARSNLGYTLSREGKLAEAIVSYEEALRIQPEHETARKGLTETRWLQAGRTSIRAN